jgi:hypothetical protein|tara:strand:- start:233 stop:679 length:447 start_codon:yes stop_codon:yes gene_type:complete
MANYNSSNANRRLKASSDKVRVMSEVIDFTSTTTANSGDTFDVIGIPANTLVMSAGVDVLVADTAGNSGTIAIGDSGDPDQYVNEVAPTSTGQQTLLVAPEAYSAGDDIRLTIATGAINGKVRVWATMMSLDKDGTDVDGDSMNVTFA